MDDIELLEDDCLSPGTCDFETSDCGWINEAGDEFDWIRTKGSTPSSNTGPDGDHTIDGYGG